MSFFDRLISEIETLYPKTAHAFDPRARLTPNLFCPHVVELPTKVREEAMAIAKAFTSLRDLPERQKALESLPPPISNPGNYSALMSYDFHLDSAGHLRLIEINTNASMSLMVDLQHRLHGVENLFSKDFRAEIIRTFKEEHQLSNVPSPLERVAIVDEAPENQRMYSEFLMYQELFESHGIKALIADARDLKSENGTLTAKGEAVQLIYNRHTDFYLQTPDTAELRKAMENNLATISPHPHEYRLLADKQRLLELSKPGAVESLPLTSEEKATIERSLIRTLDIKDFANPDDLWRVRKKYFFKPKRMYGGKAAYRGSSITKVVFEKVMQGDYLVQEYVPAPEVETSDGKFKYDLRFFAYQDRIQIACARLYQGQMTNSQTPGGGIAVIRWI